MTDTFNEKFAIPCNLVLTSARRNQKLCLQLPSPILSPTTSFIRTFSIYYQRSQQIRYIKSCPHHERHRQHHRLQSNRLPPQRTRRRPRPLEPLHQIPRRKMPILLPPPLHPRIHPNRLPRRQNHASPLRIRIPRNLLLSSFRRKSIPTR